MRPRSTHARESRRIDATRRTALQEFARRLAVEFVDLSLLDEALTHSSYTNEQYGPRSGPDNQRLEYLGDSVLGLVINEHLFAEHPSYNEGELARVKSALVSEPSLAQVAETLELGRYLKMGRGEASSGGARRRSNLGDALEAVIAAVYLDRGLDGAREFILRHFAARIEDNSDPARARDPKSRLQELLQRDARGLPEYELVSQSGPDHQREFVVRVRIDGAEQAEGRGGSRKQAEQNAAARTLELLQAKASRPAGRGVPE